MNCIAYRDPRRDLFNELKTETNLSLDYESKHSFCKVDKYEARRKNAKNGGSKEKDALNITLSNGTNFTTVHLCSQKRTFTVILRPLYSLL